MDTLEKNFERKFATVEEQERQREQSRERREATERVMEATEDELVRTVCKAQELMHAEQQQMADLADAYRQEAEIIGIEQITLRNFHEQLEEQKQLKLEAYQQLQLQLQKAA